MNFNPFAVLTMRGVVSPWYSFAVHNVQLIDVRLTENGHELLTIEYAGNTHDLIGGGQWNEGFSRRNVGKFGYIVPARPSGPSDEMPVGACYFRDYVDQSLRRVPELDNNCPPGREVGWRCDAQPQGFLAPACLIPGKDGRYVPDETEAITLRVPSEFIREARRVQMSPEELLRSFVGDLIGAQNLLACPRADGYSSNGSDERDYAESWLNRAHGMDAIDLEALEYREQEAAAAEEAAHFQREDFADLLGDYINHGGNPDDLTKAVQALVDQQQAKALADGEAEGRN